MVDMIIKHNGQSSAMDHYLEVKARQAEREIYFENTLFVMFIIFVGWLLVVGLINFIDRR